MGKRHVTCTEFLAELTDYLDGKADAAIDADICEHICVCAHCKVMLDTTRKTIQIYRDQEIYEISPSLRERLHKAIMSKCKKC